MCTTQLQRRRPNSRQLRLGFISVISTLTNWWQSCQIRGIILMGRLGNTLSWNEHINNVFSKANKTLGFLRRNLKISSREIKETAYKTLVRPIMEYAATVWDPLTQANIDSMEAIQRRAAHFVLRRYATPPAYQIWLMNWDGPHSRTDAELLALPCYTKFDTSWSARTTLQWNYSLL